MYDDYDGFEEDPRACWHNPCMNANLAVFIKDKFRLLWEQHVYWTRMVILGIAFNSPDLEETTNRLLRNATDFGMIFRRFYGSEIGGDIENLIRDHLVIAGELVKAAKAGNTKAAAIAEKKWYKNADEIVCFLRRINPYWSPKEMRDMWYEHLALTKQETVDILNNNFAASINTFNRIEKLALIMADDFSRGIIEQFGF